MLLFTLIVGLTVVEFKRNKSKKIYLHPPFKNPPFVTLNEQMNKWKSGVGAPSVLLNILHEVLDGHTDSDS